MTRIKFPNIKTLLTCNAFIVVVLLIFGACSPAKQLPTATIRPMEAERVVKRLERNSPRYRTFLARTVNVVFTNNGKQSVFKTQLKIKKDQGIIETVSKLSIPVGKARVTPKRFDFISVPDKSFLTYDIDEAREEMAGIMQYSALEALITNNYKLLANKLNIDREFSCEIQEGVYVLESSYNKRIEKALQENDQLKLEEYMIELDKEEFIHYRIIVDPFTFKMLRLEMNDMITGYRMNVEYDLLEQFDKEYFPTQIKLYLMADGKPMEMDFKLSRISINKEKNFTFSIPKSYDKLRLNLFN